MIFVRDFLTDRIISRSASAPERPLVSVIMPTYCRAGNGMLERAINSVLAQQFEDFELLVMDDGSRDGSEALIRRSLSALLRDLDPELFWQIHRGIVVNIEHVDSVVRDDGGGMTVRLRHGKAELPVSKAHQGRFRGM